MRKRTVHLDFHTSPYVKVGEKFDSHEFAQTLKKLMSTLLPVLLGIIMGISGIILKSS